MDENKMPENDGWKKNARLAIYVMAGFYLLTLAYQMFRAIPQVMVMTACYDRGDDSVSDRRCWTDRVWNYKCLQNMKKNQSTDKDRNEE